MNVICCCFTLFDILCALSAYVDDSHKMSNRILSEKSNVACCCFYPYIPFPPHPHPPPHPNTPPVCWVYCFHVRPYVHPSIHPLHFGPCGVSNTCIGISEGSVQTILKKLLDLRKVCARWVLHLLTEEQKTQRLKRAQELLKTYKGCNSRVISNLLTGDETWVHMFEPQRRTDNKQWKRKDKKRPCIAKRTISSKNMLHAIFFNSSGPVIQVPCPSGHTVTGQFYKNSVLKSFTIRNDQAKDGQEFTFYMTTPPLISVRLLSLFWLLKRCKF